MVYQRIQQTKLSDVIMARIEAMIVDGSLAPGQRLPAERELALQFSVSRPSLREAIQKLEARGLVSRRQGGGTFVTDALNTQLNEPLFELLAKHPESQFDLLEFRHALEGISSYYAAMRGTPEDLQRIQDILARVPATQQQGDIEEQARVLTDFYIRIAEASHNVILLHVVRGMQELLSENIKQNLMVLAGKDGVLDTLNEHRQRIVAAIVAGEPAQARDVCHQHLAYIEQALLQLNRENSRIQRSLRRT
ncbi:pyruvate dehydrogenase complex transcriptional repressor PdhR [Idiomarina xiamenensis]|uniref:Pyruvate dehydrogenase complex repressor n=1 Tax=Idiomarina xiamenensis 10-D-4 TaxID=740709 RepID=K2KF07_9GAMM|nr:pyruvate dehydrogenase complex transcriptional repressor PdhR [Idiomarina xiamenensis]EKE85312.1 transcriptional regulator PdhR [Idiomarina xiamenensis 10-D-4]